MKHTLPALPYAYDALEPFIDARTMELHHVKHHRAYVDKLNAALEAHPELADRPLEELLADLNRVPEDIRGAIRNNGGGHYNHSLFWQLMAPPGKGGGGEPSGALADAITKKFGGLADFKKQFSDEALKVFGSGWLWLEQKSGELKLGSYPNQDTPLLFGMKPLLGLDVWEHAYYLKYQNRRTEYIEAWWNAVSWKEASQRFEAK